LLGIARGSVLELQTQFEIAHRLDIGDGRLLGDAEALSVQVSKMLYAMIVKLKATKTN